MIRPKFCIASEGVSTDAQTNVVTIFGVVEAMVAAGFPFFIPRLIFVVLWERDNEDPSDNNAQFRAMLDDVELLQGPTTVNFQGFPRTRNTVNLNGIVIPRPGRLTLEIVLNNDTHTHAGYTIPIEMTPARVGGEPRQEGPAVATQAARQEEGQR